MIGLDFFQGNDVEQHLFHIARHAAGVAAHINVRALLQPLPHLGRGGGQLVLHIHFFCALAAPGQIGAVEQAAFAVLQPFGLIEKIVGEFLIAEHKPVFAGVSIGFALLHKSAEGCNAGAGAYHNNRRAAVFRQAEIFVRLHKHAHAAALGQALA